MYLQYVAHVLETPMQILHDSLLYSTFLPSLLYMVLRLLNTPVYLLFTSNPPCACCRTYVDRNSQ